MMYLFLRLLAFSIALSTLPAYGAINLRDIVGIDCMGQTDSSAALNGLLQNVTNQKVLWGNCQVRADSGIVIFGQDAFVIEGDSERPDGENGPQLFGCNGSGGAILTVNRSRHWRIDGIGIYPKGIRCSSAFTRSIDIDNSGAGGLTTTAGIIEHAGFTSNVQGGKIAGYVAINVIGTPNTEHMIFRDNWINCQNAAGSYGIRLAGYNSDNDLAEGNTIENCYQGIRQEIGNIRIIENHFGTNGGFSVFGPGGADIFVGGCISGPMNIFYNESADGGAFINSNDDNSGGCTRPWNIIGNSIGVTDIGPSQYPINLGTAFVPHVLIGNDMYITAVTQKTVIGSDSQNCPAYGPLGIFVDIGNYFSFPANSAGWSGCPNGPDFQHGHQLIGTW